MKCKKSETQEFKPVSFEITFETKSELYAFALLCRHNIIDITMKQFGGSTPDDSIFCETGGNDFRAFSDKLKENISKSL